MSLIWKISNVGQATYLPEAPTTRQERRAILFVSGVWLAFLAWTVIGLLDSTASIPIQVAAWAALAAFPLVYLRGFLHPRHPAAPQPTPQHTDLYGRADCAGTYYGAGHPNRDHQHRPVFDGPVDL
ncbi:MAG: hypothetical protein L0K41_03665 [Yaniella sp.]|nr:hypothetical protein [Yaniella sp.]